MKHSVKNLFTGFSILFLASCGSSSDDNPPVAQDLPAEVLDCPALVADGDSLVLGNRNSEVDYILGCDLVVNGELSIEPGVKIQASTDTGIIISGSIRAVGTIESPIVFTGENKLAGAWNGIFINSNDTDNVITQTQIEFAGGGSFNSNGDLGSVIVWADTRLTLTNSVISNSAAYGINASYGGAELVLEDNTITTSTAPMLIRGAYPTAILNGSYTGNTTDAIIVSQDQITGDHLWSKLDVPYHLPEGLQVIPGGTLTIDPGVTLEFGLDTELYINEGASGPKPSLIAVGNEENPIIFTGLNKVLGAWQGIRFDTPSVLNEIGFATIEFASNPAQSGAIYMWYGTVLNVHDVAFKDIQNCAFTTETDPNLTSANNTFTNVTAEFCEL